VKLIVVSGRSGSGKSTALHALEDQGFHCIDNLPVSLLPNLVDSADGSDVDVPFAVSIDARNLPAELDRFPEISERLRRERPRLTLEIVYLDADPATLVRRFSETRRRHPLTDGDVHLQEALEAEGTLLAGIRERADLVYDTTRMTVHGLRDEIRQRIAGRAGAGLSLMFRSFGFKNGVPVDADMVFDVRCLPNPHWLPELRDHSGREEPVQRWLAQHEAVGAMEADLRGFLERWLPEHEANARSYVTVAIGCTGGQHRSVYLAERLAEHFAAAGSPEGPSRDVLVHHRDIDQLRRLATGAG